MTPVPLVNNVLVQQYVRWEPDRWDTLVEMQGLDEQGMVVMPVLTGFAFYSKP